MRDQSVLGGSEITRELSALFAETHRASVIGACLSRLSTPQALVRFFNYYVGFNGVFAAGVTALAGAIHLNQRMFSGENGTFGVEHGRSAEIAAYVFHAAEDEYRVREASCNVTHRTLALQCASRFAAYFEISNGPAAYAHEEATLTRWTDRVNAAYGADRSFQQVDIFRGLGFHVASEQCADQEFRLLDAFLRQNFPALVQHLTGLEEKWGTSAYHWIKIHCSVEEDHWRSAEKAASMAIELYSGLSSSTEIAHQLAAGFAEFTELQESFFAFASQHPDRVD